MTTPLPERYIAATVKHLPADLQADVHAELAASIDDAVEAHIDQGEERETAERVVLTELGDPAVLAASYVDRPLQLIGPRYYLAWWRVLKLLLIIVPTVFFVLVAGGHFLAGSPLGEIIGESLATGLSAFVHVGFWVTLVFATMDRTGFETGETWDIDQLPEPRKEHPGSQELVPSLVFLGLMLVALAWDQLRGFVQHNQEAIPVLNPELWPWAMLGLLAIIALEIGFAILLFVRGRWSTPLAMTNTILAVLFFSWAITLLARGELFSAEIIELALSNGATPDALYIMGVILGLGVGIICAWDSADGWVKSCRAGSSKVTEQQPATTQ
ncbi:permease prefix domain 1-containing protein [Yaniella halotolerans]|uniref:permease prefix domain 1-containing protein n=1 Tax=Yaniella halotolerans TaxID=225453 RepID=UPI0003B49FDE|nr:permease prefix domain 1-containing protein [Yaniella halotolerans]